MKKIMSIDKFSFFFWLSIMVVTIVLGASVPLYSFEQGVFLGFHLFANIEALLYFISIILRRLKKHDTPEKI